MSLSKPMSGVTAKGGHIEEGNSVGQVGSRQRFMREYSGEGGHVGRTTSELHGNDRERSETCHLLFLDLYKRKEEMGIERSEQRDAGSKSSSGGT